MNGRIRSALDWLGEATWRPLAFILLPLWSVLIAGRGTWTPDEPREYSIALEMAQAQSPWVPTFLGQPFCEKPPLAYWASALGMRLFGASPVTARLANLLWGALAWFAIVRLVQDLADTDGDATGRRARLAAITAGLLLSTFVLALSRQGWLATDAPLLAATSVALLGLWRYLAARDDPARWRAALLFAAGMLLAFLAKNLFGWVVPGFALLAWVAWMRRPGELLRRPLWLTGLAVLALIGAWAVLAARSPGGGSCVRELFWDNTVGRLLPVATPEGYSGGHRNWPGKYLLQLPWLLFPWTLLALAAGAAALRQVRGGTDVRGAWRFCLVACVPAWLLLFVSATARDVYFLPTLPAVAAGIGLWAARPQDAASHRLDRVALPLTRWAIGALLLAAIGGAAALALLASPPLPAWRLFGPVFALLLFIAMVWRGLPRDRRAPLRIAAGVALVVAACSVAAFPAMNQRQDLAPLVHALARDIDAQVVTLGDEETIQAYLDIDDHDLHPRVLRSVADVVRAAAREPRLHVLVRTDRDARPAEMLERVRHFRSGSAAGGDRPPAPSADYAALRERGFRTLEAWRIQGGRSYALMRAGRTEDASAP
ncbi:MAG: glycosyltransferase family 39 protein [Steroidobacteraceae bacterium]